MMAYYNLQEYTKTGIKKPPHAIARGGSDFPPSMLDKEGYQ